MVTAYLGPDPEARSLRAEMIGQDMRDTLAYALSQGEFTSAEVHRDAGLVDLLQGNSRVVGHRGSSSPRYYKHWEDPEWAVIFNTDLEGNAQRGSALLQPLLEAEPEGEEK